MVTFAGMATHYQPRPPGQQPNPHADEEQFWKFARFAVHCASALAPYQSPTFRAIVVAPPPEPDKTETAKRFTLRIFDKVTDPVEDAKAYSRMMAAADDG